MYEARAFINPRMQNYHTLKAGLALGGHAASKFDILNAHIYNSVVRSGELVYTFVYQSGGLSDVSGLHHAYGADAQWPGG